MKRQRFIHMFLTFLCAVFFVCAGFAMSNILKRENTVAAHAETEVTPTIYWAVSGDTLRIGSTEQTGSPKGSFAGNYYQNWQTQITDKRIITKIEVADKISPLYLDSWFSGFENLTDISTLDNIDTSNCISLTSAFFSCNSLTTLTPISNWDVSNVTNIGSAFASCSSLTSIEALADWDVSKVSSFNGVFNYCPQLQSIEPLRNWNTASAKDLVMMFCFCGFQSTAPINSWDTSNCTDFRSIFNSINTLSIIDISNWSFDNATQIGAMFGSSAGLEVLKLSDSFIGAAQRLSSQNTGLPFPLHDAEGNVYNSVSDLKGGMTYYTNVEHTHYYIGEDTVVPPTCTEQGYTAKVCEGCGETVKSDFVAAKGHSFTNYVSDGNATCTAAGTQTATCDNCTVTDTKSITALGHDFVAGTVTAPTCTAQGYTTFNCSR
ncbi:MAG: BspA family leucine-rich repeat surface protein, partial [Clostridia bacterium]|nr:BspA family leucine-rich repeat surface protein [Clostridia bacterium]